MTPTMLRQLWFLIETAQTQELLDLDDNSLVQWLLRRLRQERSLNLDETHILNDYIYSKLSLIRDITYERASAA